MKICVVQTKSIKGNIQSNIEIHKRWIDIGISHKSDLIIFPELSLTGYEPELGEGLATGHNDTRLDDFQNISNRNNVAIGVGLPTKSNFGVFISIIIFQPNRPRQTYSKQILHSDEKPYFIEGNEQTILNIKDTKIAIAICYESLQIKHLESAIELGAEFYIASVSKSQNGIKKAFRYYPKIASKYSISVLMSNCIGFCDDFESAGQTSVWDDNGILKGQLDNLNEGLLVYDTELKTMS
jgi:predicted amidohydrolase